MHGAPTMRGVAGVSKHGGGGVNNADWAAATAAVVAAPAATVAAAPAAAVATAAVECATDAARAAASPLSANAFPSDTPPPATPPVPCFPFDTSRNPVTDFRSSAQELTAGFEIDVGGGAKVAASTLSVVVANTCKSSAGGAGGEGG